MKPLILPLLVIAPFFSLLTYAQQITPSCDVVSFDDSSIYCVSINQGSRWQIGSPQKPVFTSAFSAPNVISTDTIQSYSPSDTSSFTISYVLAFIPLISFMSGNYMVNSDSLQDYCKMELSPDNGVTWIDLVNDTTYANQILWQNSKPVFTGNSNGWTSFSVDISQLFFTFNLSQGDTVLWRCTFYSDSIQTNKDGIMFDNLSIYSWVNGINEWEFTRVTSRIFPSPSCEQITIIPSERKEISFELLIYNSTGNNVLKKECPGERITADITKFTAGIYYYEIVNESEKVFSAGRFIKD